MSPRSEPLSEIEAAITSSVAKRVLRLLPRISRTEWRNEIIPFPAVYKKVGYVMKFDRKTTQNVLKLLAARGKITFVPFHGVVLLDTVPACGRSIERHVLAATPSRCTD